MPNDHYIPRFLTKPWEFAERQLRYFDFATREFRDEPARRLFAKRELNSPGLERWFNKQIETPMGGFASSLRKGKHAGAPTDWPTQRATALLLILSSQRNEEALSPDRGAFSLETMLSWPDSKIDAIATLAFSKYKLAVVNTPSELFFTEALSFVYPMPERPVLAFPLGLWHALIAYYGPLPAGELLSNVSRNFLMPFSLGVGENVHRVILPPGWREHSVQDPDAVREHILELRGVVVQIFNLVGKASELIGLAGWGVTKS